MAATQERDVGRFNAFTDGVIVVSMTLLVLNIELPDNVHTLSDADLWDVIIKLRPNYLGYVLSFLVVAQYWMGYTDYFGTMQRVDDGFAWRAIFFMLVIGFVPFATALVARNGGRLATSVYAATMVAAAALLIAMSHYATRNGLIERRFPSSQWWREISGWLQIGFVFGASIIVAQFDAALAKLVWLLLALPSLQSLRWPSWRGTRQ